MSGAALLEVIDLAVEYVTGHRRAPLRAVDGVSLSIAANETLGVVGESGSGKSTIGRAILGLVPATGGSIRFAGEDITRAPRRVRRALASSLQVIFQDPYASLNPARTIGQAMAETLRAPPAIVNERVRTMLERVGLPADAAARYPSRFSGGQRQRIAIARALMGSPRLVVCDEPVSALDLSVQAQVLNLLTELQRDLRVSYLFVSHDIAVVRHVSHRILVLYRGRVMEHGDARTVFERPAHPYTVALLKAAPVPDPQRQRRRHATIASRAAIADAVGATGDACPFASRCPHAIDVCRRERPQLEATDEGVLVACHRWQDLRARRQVERAMPLTMTPTKEMR